MLLTRDLKHYSLPRRKPTSSLHGDTPFTRATPIRNSTTGARSSCQQQTPAVEYFVPRSVSEFNLSILVDPPLPPSALRSSNIRSRDKMVTFEDDPVPTAHQQNIKPIALEDVFM
ncbi:hypothetical protein LSTR_LSTR011574 [Laodelphax striatellus]|uniref:Uncharacterized protein n=1 Tax=Laodelphax striatellus TaxID=195883 RepID=A0A482X654_LAOST|nr:hypothetical protein LSTR_LSTR011574 [Laodelphax striatellus]